MKRKQLRQKVLERDNFTCQKCGLQNKEGNLLEAHHIIPLIIEGKDDLTNMITLCKDCHYYAPNNKGDFENYIKEECTGTMTIITKILQNLKI